MSRFTSGGGVYAFQAADTGTWAWVTSEPLIWEVRGLYGLFDVVVPATFVTDLGTVPAWARPFINPADPQLAKAFILHDWLLKAFGSQCQFFAASQLYEALRALGVQKWKRITIWVTVTASIDDW